MDDSEEYIIIFKYLAWKLSSLWRTVKNSELKFIQSKERIFLVFKHIWNNQSQFLVPKCDMLFLLCRNMAVREVEYSISKYYVRKPLSEHHIRSA